MADNQKKKNDSKKKDDKGEEKKDGEPEVDTSAKHISLFILAALILYIICYGIFSYEAYKNGIFPFGDYVTVPPPGVSFQPTVDPTKGYDPTANYDSYMERLTAAGYEENTDEKKEGAKQVVADILNSNCAWWCKGKFYVDNNADNAVDAAKIAKHNNDSFGNRFASMFFGGGDEPKNLFYKQNVLKPREDTGDKTKDGSGNSGCNCDNSSYVLPGTPDDG
jgi:hypothetical protein